MTVPETVWIPPELRKKNGKELEKVLHSLLERIEEVETLIGKLNIESRLTQIERLYS